MIAEVGSIAVDGGSVGAEMLMRFDGPEAEPMRHDVVAHGAWNAPCCRVDRLADATDGTESGDELKSDCVSLRHPGRGPMDPFW